MQFVELASVPEHIDEVLLLNGVKMSLFHIDPQSEGILKPGEPVVGRWSKVLNTSPTSSAMMALNTKQKSGSGRTFGTPTMG